MRAHPLVSTATPALSSRIVEAITLLLQARQYADDARSDIWNFAVEIGDLYQVGLTKNDLRWLIAKGYLEQAIETTKPLTDGERSFERVHSLLFLPNMCFVLSEHAIQHLFGQEKQLPFATSLPLGGEVRAANSLAESFLPKSTVEPHASNGSASPAACPPHSTPRWNKHLRTLSVGNAVVKHFRVPADNQVLILSAFEEEGWPDHVYDPLPPAAEIDPKRRLHDAINRLNRNQKQRLIHFYGNGNGRAIRWKLIPKPYPSDT